VGWSQRVRALTTWPAVQPPRWQPQFGAFKRWQRPVLLTLCPNGLTVTLTAVRATQPTLSATCSMAVTGEHAAES